MALNPTLRRLVLEAVVHRLNVDREPDIPQASLRRYVQGQELRSGQIGVWKHEEKPATIGRSARFGNALLRPLELVTQIVTPTNAEEAELVNDPAEAWVISRLAEWVPSVSGVHKFKEQESAWETLEGGSVTYRVSTIVWACEFQTLSADLTKAQ